MATMQLELRDSVHVLTLTNNDNENKFNMDVMAEYSAALDTVAAYEGNTALLITCEHEKTFSTGIDLAWLMSETPENQIIFTRAIERVLYKLAMLNAPSVVCVNGNVYAGAAIMATAADYRVMRSDRGRYCYPEVNIGIPFTDLMNHIVDLSPNKHVLKKMALEGKALTGVECKAANLVDSIYPQAELQEAAFALAKSLSEKARSTYTTIKRGLRPNIAKYEYILSEDAVALLV